MIGILGGAFLFGIWFMLMRSDDRELRTMSLQRRDAKRKGAPDFSQAHDEFSKKLAEVEDYLNTKRRNERALLIAKEEAKKEVEEEIAPIDVVIFNPCLLYTSPSPRDKRQSRMPSSA